MNTAFLGLTLGAGIVHGSICCAAGAHFLYSQSDPLLFTVKFYVAWQQAAPLGLISEMATYDLSARPRTFVFASDPVPV